ncbi:MAG: urea ABC transporter permease subunit UrtB [Gammaproteobacteria bacterium]
MNTNACNRKGWLVFVLMLLFSIPAAGQEAAGADAFSEALVSIQQGSMQQREQGIAQLAEIKNPRSLIILQALLDGKLFGLKADGRLVIGEERSQGFLITDAVTGVEEGNVSRSSLNKMNLTNRLRAGLRKSIGLLQLSSEDPDERLAAVQAIAKDTDEQTLALLRALRQNEKDNKVRREIGLIFLLRELDNPDGPVRLNAIESLKDYDSREVVNRLKAITERDAGGNYLEKGPEIRKSADRVLRQINARINLYGAAETVFFGLSLGAVLVLAAIGLAITFGVMGVINMAHGELMMLGAYTTYVIQQMMPDYLGLSIILAIPAAFLMSALTGIAIERGIIRFLYGRPLETLLATFGVSLILQQGVRSVFSPLNRSVSTPDWMSGSLQINDFLSLTWNRFYILVFCILVFMSLLHIIKFTRLGLEVRAVAQNRNMARAMGIPTGWVDAMTFGLGSGIAGVAGVALSQITNVGPNLGQAYIVDSFMVVVFGGVGNLWGTLVAGFSLGIANKFLEPYAGAVLAKILVLVFIILFIQTRPRGLFPQKGRAAES